MKDNVNVPSAFSLMRITEKRQNPYQKSFYSNMFKVDENGLNISRSHIIHMKFVFSDPARRLNGM